MQIGIVQPILARYRLPVYLELSRYCRVDLLFSKSNPGLGFGDNIREVNSNVRYFQIPTIRPCGNRLGMIQLGLGKYIIREKPDAIVIFASPRYLSFWTTILLARLYDIPIYAHGHGLIRKARVGFGYKLMTWLQLRLVSSYIGYAPCVLKSFAEHGFPTEKIRVAHNSLNISSTVKPNAKTGRERAILFLGRLRRDSKLPLLLRVVRRLREEEAIYVTVHVVGGGECAAKWREENRCHAWILWHGEIYDEQEVCKISSDCFMGCCPGNAGLSVVHMMALSLPVVTHDDFTGHGPEVSFIRDEENGLLFDYRTPEESLLTALRRLANDPLLVTEMQRAAFSTYQELATPSLAKRLWAIVGEDGFGSANSVPSGTREAVPSRADLL